MSTGSDDDGEKTPAGTPEALLAEIHEASAHDDLALPARHAYAELLLRRGDPLGRFIQLQSDRIARADWPTDEEKRLVWDHWREWIGAPAQVLEWSGVDFLHGFWHHCTGFDYTKFPRVNGAATIADAPTWGTVKKLSTAHFLPVDFVRALLSGPLHRSVRQVSVGTASQLAALATWSGPPLALHTLTFVDNRGADAPLATAFPGLPGLPHFAVRLEADSIIDWERTRRWLLEGACGPDGDVRVLEVSVGGRVHNSDDPMPWMLHMVPGVRSPTLRVLELYGDWMMRARFERDEAGPWTRLRARWLPAWHQRHLPIGDVERFSTFVSRLPRDGTELVLDVANVTTEPSVADALARLAERVGARIERTPPPPYPAEEIGPLDPKSKF